VEDDEALRQMMALELADIGYEVATAGNCREAREVMSRESIHFAILDVGLPDGNGIDLAGDLAADYPSLRLLLCSGSHGACAGRSVPPAVLACLIKPISARQLDRKLRAGGQARAGRR
jgi:DNA-binding response OmpR family regulator